MPGGCLCDVGTGIRHRSDSCCRQKTEEIGCSNSQPTEASPQRPVQGGQVDLDTQA